MRFVGELMGALDVFLVSLFIGLLMTSIKTRIVFYVFSAVFIHGSSTGLAEFLIALSMGFIASVGATSFIYGCR